MTRICQLPQPIKGDRGCEGNLSTLQLLLSPQALSIQWKSFSNRGPDNADAPRHLLMNSKCIATNSVRFNKPTDQKADWNTIYFFIRIKIPLLGHSVTSCQDGHTSKAILNYTVCLQENTDCTITCSPCETIHWKLKFILLKTYDPLRRKLLRPD